MKWKIIFRKEKASIDLSDVRDFIKDVKRVFYDKEKEMSNEMRYSMIKRIVYLRIKETKLIAKKIGGVV